MNVLDQSQRNEVKRMNKDASQETSDRNLSKRKKSRNSMVDD